MDITEGLKKLQQLHLAGGLTDEEYALAKKALFEHVELQTQDDILSIREIGNDVITDPEARKWGMFLHLSMLAGFIIPFSNFVIPFIIWQAKKNQLLGIDEHGRNAVNWIISQIFYFIAFFIMFVGGIDEGSTTGILAFLAMIVVGIVSVMFPIIAGIKANNGEIWRYPLAIRLLKS